MGYLKSIGTVIIYIGFFLAVITFVPGLPPQAEYSEYSIKQPSDVKIQFELKNRLQGAEVLFPGELIGPEDFASYNGEVYTGIRGGYVVKIEGNHIKPIVKFGKKCDGLWQEEKCGRPLGLKFNSKGELFVADSYYGIFKVNVDTRQYVNIVNSSEPIEGKVPKIINSLDIAKNGDIYWTDSSTDFPLYNGIYAFLANPSGRLIRYNAATKKNEVLIKNLGFANGVLLSDDEDFVIVLECLTSRIVKYNLKGSNIGQKEIFIEALPGLPDNVHSDEHGGFLVSLFLYVDAEYPFLSHSLTPHPYIRKMFSRLLYFIELPFQLLQDAYPNYYAEKVLHTLGSFDMSGILDVKRTSVVLRIDKMGKVLDALYSDDGKVHTISSAYMHNGYLWLGSPLNDYVMRVPLKQALPQLATKHKFSSAKEQTASQKTNIKEETKSSNVKTDEQHTTVKPTQVPTAKTETIQKSSPDLAMSKPIDTTNTAAPQPSKAAPKPTSIPTASKTLKNEIKKDNLKAKPKGTDENGIKEVKKDNPKQIKKDDSKEIKENKKEIKKDNLNLNTKPLVTKKVNDGVVKQNLKDSVRKEHETRPSKSKPVEQENEPTRT